MKRLANVAYLNGLPLEQSTTGTVQTPIDSFISQVGNTENEYNAKAGNSMFDNFQTLDRFRATVGRWTGLPTIWHAGTQDGDLDYKFQTRSAWGLSLLLDVPIVSGPKNPNCQNTIDALLKCNYYSDDAEWVPYWRSGHLVQSGNPQIAATVYLNHGYKGPYAFFVVFNAGNAETEAEVTLKGDLAGRTITDPVDGESVKAEGNKVKLKIKRHDYRFIEVGR